MTKSLLVVGNINYDIIFPTDKLPGSHEKMRVDDAILGFGGAAANTAWWLGRMGLPVIMAGAVGDDVLGKACLEDLRRAGVRTDGVERVALPTGTTAVFAKGREKRMVRAPGANMGGKVHPWLLEGCRAVYLSGMNRTLITDYAVAAQEKGVPVFCGGVAPGEWDILEDAEGVILNQDELSALTGEPLAGKGILRLPPRLAAVTLAQGGCLVKEGEKVTAVRAPEVEPVDRTGGGDAFAAGFLAGLVLGEPLVKCAERGNGLAREVILRWGTRPEINVDGR